MNIIRQINPAKTMYELLLKKSLSNVSRDVKSSVVNVEKTVDDIDTLKENLESFRSWIIGHAIEVDEDPEQIKLDLEMEYNE